MDVKKRCSKCKIEKNINEFGNCKTRKDGKHPYCKECRKEYAKKNKDKIKKKQSEWYENSKERILEKRSNYYKENKNKISEYKKEYYEKNKKEILKQHKEYCENNKDELLKKQKEYYENNKEEISKRNKKYQKEHPDVYRLTQQRRNAIKNKLPNTLTVGEWNEILDNFNHKCVLTNTNENLHLEHFIPLSIGHGGTCKENVYPMEGKLNISKSNKNPFEWIKKQSEDIRNNFYNVLIPYLSTQNNMSEYEFEKYVNWCFDNPITFEDVIKQTN